MGAESRLLRQPVATTEETRAGITHQAAPLVPQRSGAPAPCCGVICIQDGSFENKKDNKGKDIQDLAYQTLGDGGLRLWLFSVLNGKERRCVYRTYCMY